FLQQIILFVRGAVVADDANRIAALRISNLFELRAGQAQRMLPGCRFQLACRVANQRLGQTISRPDKIKSKPTLSAEKIAVDAALVAVVRANNLSTIIRLLHAERHLASIAAVR